MADTGASVTLKVTDKGTAGEVEIAVTANPPFPKNRSAYTAAQSLAVEAALVLTRYHGDGNTEENDQGILTVLFATLEDLDNSDYEMGSKKVLEAIEIVKAGQRRRVEALLTGRSSL